MILVHTICEVNPSVSIHSFIHSFFICQIYKNFTMQGWNNDIKEKVNGEET